MGLLIQNRLDVPLKRALTREELIEDRANGVQVGGGPGGRKTLCLFGRHISRCSKDTTLHGDARILKPIGRDTKVGDVTSQAPRGVTGNKNIIRL